MNGLLLWTLAVSCGVVLPGQHLHFPSKRPSISKCRTRNGVEGECVAINQCEYYQTRHGILSDYPISCRYEGRTPIICCRKSASLHQCGLPKPYIRSIVDGAKKARCRELAAVTNTRCIVRARNAELGKWPWMALLGSTSTQRFNSTWYCGGALISRRHVVTAAHCIVEPAERMVVRLGDYDLLLSDEVDHQEVSVARVVKHPQYRGGQNDIAILELTPPVNFTRSVQPICLPPAGADFQGVRADLAGWGVTEYAGKTTPNILQEITLLVADENECENTFKGAPSFPRKFPGGFQGTKICCVDPQGGNKDACNGDSGGPLVYQTPGTRVYRLIGVISTGIGCGNPQFPGVYTKVSAYVDWIYQVIGV